MLMCSYSSIISTSTTLTTTSCEIETSHEKLPRPTFLYQVPWTLPYSDGDLDFPYCMSYDNQGRIIIRLGSRGEIAFTFITVMWISILYVLILYTYRFFVSDTCFLKYEAVIMPPSLRVVGISTWMVCIIYPKTITVPLMLNHVLVLGDWWIQSAFGSTWQLSLGASR